MALRDWVQFDFLCWRLSTRPRRFIVLVRHFFIRFFQNDVFPFEEQMKEKLYVVLAMLAPLGWILASSLYSGYIFAPDHGQSWFEKCILISFFMALMVFITTLEWDVLFIDRRDYVNLAGLPIRPGTIFRAKFVSLLFFVALYAASVVSLSGLATGFFLPQYIGNSIGTFFLYLLAHTAALTLSFYFAFFLILSLQAVLLLLLGPRLFSAVLPGRPVRPGDGQLHFSDYLSGRSQRAQYAVPEPGRSPRNRSFCFPLGSPGLVHLDI